MKKLRVATDLFTNIRYARYATDLVFQQCYRTKFPITKGRCTLVENRICIATIRRGKLFQTALLSALDQCIPDLLLKPTYYAVILTRKTRSRKRITQKMTWMMMVASMQNQMVYSQQYCGINYTIDSNLMLA